MLLYFPFIAVVCLKYVKKVIDTHVTNMNLVCPMYKKVVALTTYSLEKLYATN